MEPIALQPPQDAFAVPHLRCSIPERLVVLRITGLQMSRKQNLKILPMPILHPLLLFIWLCSPIGLSKNSQYPGNELPALNTLRSERIFAVVITSDNINSLDLTNISIILCLHIFSIVRNNERSRLAYLHLFICFWTLQNMPMFTMQNQNEPIRLDHESSKKLILLRSWILKW